MGRSRRCCLSKGRNLSTFMFSGMKQKLISYLQGSFHRFSSPLFLISPFGGKKWKLLRYFHEMGLTYKLHRTGFIYNIAAVGNINNYSLLHMNIMLMSSIASWTCFLSPFSPWNKFSFSAKSAKINFHSSVKCNEAGRGRQFAHDEGWKFSLCGL